MVDKVLFSSVSEEWITPPDLFNKLNEEFHFELDPCTNKDNPLHTKFYFTREDNGLEKSWQGSSIYINPPYNKEIPKWIEKTVYELGVNPEINKVVMLLPSRTDTSWMHQYILPFCGWYKEQGLTQDYIKDLNWAAGFIDGEGCIFIRRNKYSENSICHDLGIQVTNTNRTPIDRLQKIFGLGYIRIERKSNSKWRTAYRWVCRSNDAENVLRVIEPYLYNKREEARLGLEFQNGPKTGKGYKILKTVLDKRQEQYLKMQELKKLTQTTLYYRTEIRFLKGRLKFVGAKNSAPFPSMVVIFTR